MSFSYSVVYNGQMISDYSSKENENIFRFNTGGSSGSQSPGVQSPSVQSPSAQSPSVQSSGVQLPGAEDSGVQNETETPRSSTGGLSTISNQDSTSELIAAYETAFDEMTAGAIQSLENGINDMHAKNSETAAKAALKLGKGFTF